MSNRGEFVGTAPTSGNYIPAPTPAEQEDLPVYINDELLRLGGVVNGVLEGGSLPPHSELPKRYKEGMIMNFSSAVGDGVDSSGVWLYKKAKWWKLIDDPTTITEEIEKKLEVIEDEISSVDADLIALNSDLSELDGKFPIKEVDISDDAISAPKIQANSITGDKLVANSIGADKIVANSITGNKIKVGTEISAPLIKGGSFVTDSGTDTRVDVGDDGTYLIWAGAGNKVDSNATFFIKKDGTGFIKGEFFQGEIISTVTGSASNINNNLTAQTQTYTSAGKTAVVNFSASCSLYVNVLNSDENMTLSVGLYRGNTLIDTISTMANKFYEPPEPGIHNGRTYFTAPISDTFIDNGTSIGTNSYKIITTYSGVSSPFIVTRNTVSLSAQEDKLS